MVGTAKGKELQPRKNNWRLLKMLDRYFKIEVEKVKARQNADGTWVCSEVKANSVKELDNMIGEINRILNKYNKCNEKKAKESINVKGLK